MKTPIILNFTWFCKIIQMQFKVRKIKLEVLDEVSYKFYEFLKIEFCFEGVKKK